MIRTRALASVLGLGLIASVLALVPALAADNNDSVGVADRTTGIWYLRSPGGQTTSFFFGNPGDYPIMGDWNCDGVDTPGLYRQSDGYVYLRNSNTQGPADIRFFFGDPGDIPLAGDFNGDGCDTVSIYRPGEARVFVINELGSNDGGLGAADFAFYFGDVGDKPFTADFDDDGIDEVGLHRESTGFVYYRNTLTTGIADNDFFFGDPNDQIIAGRWIQNLNPGPDTVGIFRPSNGRFYLRFSNSQGNADVGFPYGNSDMAAIAGHFGDLPGGNPAPLSSDPSQPRVLDSAGDVGADSSVAIAPDGSPIVAFFDDAAKELRVRKCADPKCQRSTVSTIGAASTGGALIIGSDGLPAVAYVSGGELIVAHCNDQACTSHTTRNVTGSDGRASVTRPDMALGSDGFPIVAYREYSLLMVAHCVDVRCANASLVAIESAGVGVRPSIEVGSDGLPAIAYYKPTAYDLRFLHCSNVACLNGTIVTLDGGTYDLVGQAPSLAIGSDGNPIISHYVWSNDRRDLMVTHCLDVFCSADTNRTIDSEGNVGSDSAIVGVPNGYPIIAYYDATRGALKVYFCQTHACNRSGNTPSIVDEGGVGTYPAIALGADGVPVVIYRDFGNGFLKIVFPAP